jgi:hypothetical protein
LSEKRANRAILTGNLQALVARFSPGGGIVLASRMMVVVARAATTVAAGDVFALQEPVQPITNDS